MKPLKWKARMNRVLCYGDRVSVCTMWVYVNACVWVCVSVCVCVCVRVSGCIILKSESERERKTEREWDKTWNIYIKQAGCTLRCMGFFLWQTHKPNLPNLPGRGSFFFNNVLLKLSGHSFEYKFLT